MARKKLNWEEALEHLRTCKQAYSELDPPAVFILVIIQTCQDRYDRGERTKWLYDDIMSIAL